MTELNIQAIVQRVRDKLPDDVRERIQVATYNETCRFNRLIIDHKGCVAQP